jgi:hypothetical protein
MVGNGATDWDVDVSPSFPMTVAEFSLVPKSLLDTFTTEGCHYYFYDEYDTTPNSDICNQTWDKINTLT